MKNYMFGTGIHILDFVDCDSSLKLRNVSSKMRNRIRIFVKNKSVLIRKYEKGALVLNNSVSLSPSLSPGESILKGVSNYSINNEEELKILLASGIFTCGSLNLTSNLTDNYRITLVKDLTVSSQSFNFYSKLKFSTVESLDIYNMKAEQITQITAQIDNLTRFVVRNSVVDLESLSKFKEIEFIRLDNTKVVNKGYFPRLKHLMIQFSDGFEQLVCPGLLDLSLFIRQSTETTVKWVSMLSRLKKVNIGCREGSFSADSFPKTIRYLIANSRAILKKEATLILSKCKYLLDFSYHGLKLSDLEKVKVRFVRGEVEDDLTGHTSLRLKFMELSWRNLNLFTNHPEMTGSIENLVVNTTDLDWNDLPKRLKSIQLICVNEKGRLVNRTAGKR